MIIVFGALNIDVIMPVASFPKPGETVLTSIDYLSTPGGKGGNQAVAAAQDGAKVAFVGKVGDDSFGRRCVASLKNHGIWASGVGISDRPTGCSTIAVNTTGDNFVITAPGANLDATNDQVPDEVLGKKNILLTQMEVTPKETFAVLERAKKMGATTIFNASPAGRVSIKKITAVDYLIVNEIEARQLAEGLGVSAADPKDIALNIARTANLTCLITLEAAGSIAAQGDKVYAVGALPVKVVDSTGAGDVFCGIFAASLQKGMDWLAAWHRASIGASLACTRMGAQSENSYAGEIDANKDSVLLPRLIS
jgi:ribokinase